MALTIPAGQPHTAAAVATLEAAGLTVGNGSGNDPATGALYARPYVVVYGDLGALDGPLGDRFADLSQTLTVHGVGNGPEQAQWVADKARAALLTTPVTVAGRSTLYVSHTTSQPVQRDDDVQPPLFYEVDQYTLSTTPA
jgi:hypothetical protein